MVSIPFDRLNNSLWTIRILILILFFFSFLCMCMCENVMPCLCHWWMGRPKLKSLQWKDVISLTALTMENLVTLCEWIHHLLDERFSPYFHYLILPRTSQFCFYSSFVAFTNSYCILFRIALEHHELKPHGNSNYTIKVFLKQLSWS